MPERLSRGIQLILAELMGSASESRPAVPAWGRLAAAQKRFEQALVLNPDNWSAAVDLQCNTNLQAGKKLDLEGMAHGGFEIV